MGMCICKKTYCSYSRAVCRVFKGCDVTAVKIGVFLYRWSDLVPVFLLMSLDNV